MGSLQKKDSTSFLHRVAKEEKKKTPPPNKKKGKTPALWGEGRLPNNPEKYSEQKNREGELGTESQFLGLNKFQKGGLVVLRKERESIIPEL